MRNKAWIASLVSVLLVLVFVLTSCTPAPTAPPVTEVPKTTTPPVTTPPATTPPALPSILAGKTVWVIDVNTNEDYKAVLQPTIVELLPEYAPGVTVRHIVTGEKNPFFLLKQENYPDAAIIGLGVCVATTPQSVNYAAEAKSRGIPAVIYYLSDMRQSREKSVEAYRIPDLRFIEIDGLPITKQEAEPVARKLIPLFIESLTPQFK